jgi:acetyl esterase/lipase
MSVLEPAAQEFAPAAAQAPPLHQVGPVAVRRAPEDIQARATAQPDVDVSWVTVSGGGIDVRARIVRPWNTSCELLPVLLYLHGGGWVLGSASTHDRLAGELAVRAQAADVFVEYDLSPEVRYPVALHQTHAVAAGHAQEG